MSRFRTPVTLFGIALFVVLPLYELADYGEHWPNDGDYVSMVLFVLFLAGLALVFRIALTPIIHTQTAARLVVLTRVSQPVARPICPAVRQSIAGCTDSPPFLILHDFRI